MNKGRIDAVLAEETVSQCVEMLEQIEQNLPMLLRLKTSEKNRLVKPRAGAEAVMQTIAAVQAQAGIPPAADDAMLADLSVYVGLTKIADRLSALSRLIEDTRMQAGSEGWNESLIRYGMLRQLERGNPDLKAGLDRVRPLITSRSNRPAPTPVEDAPGTPAPTDPESAE